MIVERKGDCDMAFSVFVACRFKTSSGWRTEVLPISVEAPTSGEARLRASDVYESWKKSGSVSRYKVLCAVEKEDLQNGQSEEGHGF